MYERLKSFAAAGKPFAFTLALSVPFGATASAQVTIDVSEITCDQFALYKVSDPDTIAVWLHGYYSGKKGDTVVDVEKLKSNAKKLRDYCLENPDTNLLAAVESLMKP
ncbi:HdeA/HdeB family chaperone [Methyloceanibacter sp. wino2]|uniref:HdeA/HdeB family chaperone n=1 Tax=Methyloceanibacter sp. wino2 TaxID=2170729 RepID=UPI000D3E4FFE|nr:HdeA/HdeB family chaperone [Methyloceanibacter sp. wino2]